MHKISCNGDEVYILKNFLSNKECDKYFKMIDDIGYNAKPIPWEERAVEITTDPIVDKVTKYINERFNLNLIVEQAETQNLIQFSMSMTMKLENTLYIIVSST